MVVLELFVTFMVPPLENFGTQILSLSLAVLGIGHLCMQDSDHVGLHSQYEP